MALSIQFLGSGTSVGVPQIGCDCPTCTSKDPRDRRRRSGVYVESATTAILVDTPPEFRIACLELNIRKADALFITHAHMDHLAGFDDIRRFNTLNGGKPIHCYAAEETIASIHSIFPYITDKKNTQGLYRPMILFDVVKRARTIGDIKVTPVPVIHGPRTNGYVFGCNARRIAYVPDCHEIPEKSKRLLRGVDILVLDCLRGDRPHPTHMILPETLAAICELEPKKAILTHMCHSVKHADFEKLLPEGVSLAYDGRKETV